MPNPSSLIFLTKNGKADDHQDDKLSQLRQILSDPNAKVLLHLHGGLIDEAAGLAIAKRLSGKGGKSWNLKPGWTQVYVVWRTGALETIKTNWTELATNDRLYKIIVRKLLGFVARKLNLPLVGGRSASSALSLSDKSIRLALAGKSDKRDPFASVDVHFDDTVAPGQRATLAPNQSPVELRMEFEAELGDDREFQAAVANIDGVVKEQTKGRTLLPASDRKQGEASLGRLSQNVKSPWQLAGNNRVPAGRGAVSVTTFLLKHAGKIALRCFKRFRSHRDHGFHATIVEEVCRELYGDLVGSTIWGFMTKDAANHFAADRFGSTLVQYMTGSKARLAVTAHSAGSIWASHLLLAMKQAGLQKPIDLFLLAPAVRHSLFDSALGNAGSLIGTCRMFTMTDEFERKDAVLGHDKGYIYPSSLLYLVSGMFENRDANAYPDAPILGMQRFLDAPWLDPNEQAAAQRISAFFHGPNASILSSPTQNVTLSETHGGFDDDVATLTSIRNMVG